MTFQVRCLQFTLEALEQVYFPRGKASNVLRGALGTILDSEIFSPKQSGGPSGLSDPPRPFVFRSSHLDGATIAPGKRFSFEMNIFDQAPSEGYVQAVRSLQALGPGRARIDLLKCEERSVTIDLTAQQHGLKYIEVRFQTPTELKGSDGLMQSPEFGVLLSRMRDRISTLRALYGAGPLAIDFRAFGERANRVRMLKYQVNTVDRERKSSRTGQTHSIGGFTGDATYEGDLAEFAPFLDAAVYTGVGRQTVWGKGEIKWQPLRERPE
jgi:hypothetical protein